MTSNVSAILRLTYTDMLYIQVILNIALESSDGTSKRVQYIKEIHKKITAVLEQADKAGKIDHGTLNSNIESLKDE